MSDLLQREVKPLAVSVLVDPSRWNELMTSDDPNVWSMRFLFEKQLEEADIIVINKIDVLDADALAKLKEEIQRRCTAKAGAPVLR